MNRPEIISTNILVTVLPEHFSAAHLLVEGGISGLAINEMCVLPSVLFEALILEESLWLWRDDLKGSKAGDEGTGWEAAMAKSGA